jgi:hypothetical protein
MQKGATRVRGSVNEYDQRSQRAGFSLSPYAPSRNRAPYVAARMWEMIAAPMSSRSRIWVM